MVKFPVMGVENMLLRQPTGESAVKAFLKAQKRAYAAAFAGDRFLVHGDVSRGQFGNAVAPEGIYSQRFITLETPRELAALAIHNATDLVITCMDDRVARPLVESIKTLQGIPEEQIAVFAIAGGPIQPGKMDIPVYVNDTRINEDVLLRRKGAVTAFFKWALIEDALGQQAGSPALQRIHLVAHTSSLTGIENDRPCGGARLFGRGIPIGQAADRQTSAELIRRYGIDEIPALQDKRTQQEELAVTVALLARARNDLLTKGIATQLYDPAVLSSMISALVVAPQPNKEGSERLVAYPVSPEENGARLVELIR